MKVAEFFERYHIEPLKYADGKELDDQDWRKLFLFLLKVYKSLELAKEAKVPVIPQWLQNKVDVNSKRAMFPLTSGEIMDMFLEQEQSPVLNVNLN